MPSNESNLRYIFLLAAFFALFWAQEDVEVAKAVHYPITAVVSVEARIPVQQSPAKSVVVAHYPSHLMQASARVQYRATPTESSFPDKWVDIYQNKERWTVSWLPTIEPILGTGKYPHVKAIDVLGVIIQESGGDPNVECVDTPGFICGGGGLMGIAAGRCGYTEQQLQNPTKNIECGIRMLNQIYGQALEHGFEPGREAARATLGGYNCGFKSLLTERCYSYGGFAYADLIFIYWQPLLEKYLEGQNGS